MQFLTACFWSLDHCIVDCVDFSFVLTAYGVYVVVLLVDSSYK